MSPGSEFIDSYLDVMAQQERDILACKISNSSKPSGWLVLTCRNCHRTVQHKSASYLSMVRPSHQGDLLDFCTRCLARHIAPNLNSLLGDLAGTGQIEDNCRICHTPINLQDEFPNLTPYCDSCRDTIQQALRIQHQHFHLSDWPANHWITLHLSAVAIGLTTLYAWHGWWPLNLFGIGINLYCLFREFRDTDSAPAGRDTGPK